jgi:hypothetical protein
MIFLVTEASKRRLLGQRPLSSKTLLIAAKYWQLRTVVFGNLSALNEGAEVVSAR